MKKKIQDLIALYGKLALITYFVIFLLVFFSFYFAIQAGVDLESWSLFEGKLEQAGTAVVAYVATKITQPIRIAVTVALTPLIARILGKEEKKGAEKVSN